MALIQRGNCTYLIRSVRRNGRVTSEYEGSGPAALLEGRFLAFQRFRGEAERQCGVAVEAPLTVLALRLEEVVSETLIRAGFHRPPGRRTWRKRRGPYMSKSRKKDGVPAKATPSGAPPAEDRPPRLTTALMRRAQQGDKEAGRKPTRILDAEPDMLEAFLETDLGDVAAAAECALAETFAFKNLLQGAMFKWRLRSQADALAGPDAPPLEKMLARHVAACDAAAHWAERRLMLHMAGKSYLPGESFLHQFADRSHRRLISVAKLLAALRRPGAPQVLCVQAVKVALPPGSAAPNESPSFPELSQGKECDHS